MFFSDSGAPYSDLPTSCKSFFILTAMSEHTLVCRNKELIMSERVVCKSTLTNNCESVHWGFQSSFDLLYVDSNGFFQGLCGQFPFGIILNPRAFYWITVMINAFCRFLKDSLPDRRRLNPTKGRSQRAPKSRRLCIPLILQRPKAAPLWERSWEPLPDSYVGSLASERDFFWRWVLSYSCFLRYFVSVGSSLSFAMPIHQAPCPNPRFWSMRSSTHSVDRIFVWTYLGRISILWQKVSGRYSRTTTVIQKCRCLWVTEYCIVSWRISKRI